MEISKLVLWNSIKAHVNQGLVVYKLVKREDLREGVFLQRLKFRKSTKFIHGSHKISVGDGRTLWVSVELPALELRLLANPLVNGVVTYSLFGTAYEASVEEMLGGSIIFNQDKEIICTLFLVESYKRR